MKALSPGIEKILTCFRLCETQIRATSGGIIGFDWNVFFSAAQLMDIPVDIHFVRYLKEYESVFIEEIRAGNDGKKTR